MKPAFALRAFLLGSSLLASVNPAHAVDYYWDANGSTTTATGGAGTWNTSSSLWRNGSATGTLSTWPNTASNTDTARLAGTAGTVTLNSSSVNINVNKIIFGTNGYNIAGPTSGTATLNLTGATPTIDVTTGTASHTATISAKITGSAGLASTGTGVLILSGDNSGLSGGITSSGTGQLSLRHNNAAGTGTISFASTQTGTAATFTVSDGVNISNDIILDSANGRNTINSLSGSNTLSGDISINNNSGNAVVFQNSAAAGSGTTFTIGGAAPNSTTITAATYSNAISFRAAQNGESGVLNSRINAPNANFNINNQGFWTIKSTGNTWAVTTLSSATSRIMLGADDALATGARIEFAASASGFVNLNGFNQSVAGLAGSNIGSQIRNDSTTGDSIVTLAGLAADRSFGGEITDGTGGRKTSLVMNSSGRIQTLAGTNTFTGQTTISAGTLYITGALSNSAVTVEANGAIGRNDVTAGGGTLGNGLTIEAGGGLDLTGATLSSNSTGILGLTGGTLALGNLTFQDLVGWDWANAEVGTYELIDGAFSIDWGSTAYLSAATAYDFGNGKKGYFTSGSLNVVVIPEPRAALLGGLGLLALLRRRKY